MPVMSLRGRGRAHAGYGYRVCTTCSARVIYASRLVVDCTNVEPDLVVDAVLCDACVKARLSLRTLVNPLPVLTVAQRKREAKPRVRTKTCRPCGGAGCHRCDGKGRVAA